MDQILGMKVFFYFLFAICSVVECKTWFKPTGPGGSSQPEQLRSLNQKVWKIGELGTKSKTDLQKYLSVYGYTDGYTDRASGDQLDEKIKDLQHFAGLPTTGDLDPATIQVINTDRCGIKDPKPRKKRRDSEIKIKLGRSGRQKRYNHQGTTWRHLTLTWQYIPDPWQRNKKVSENQVREVMKSAMEIWSAVTNIQFEENRNAFTVDGPDEPDILVKFVSDSVGKHSKVDPFPFDGQGGTLAHAFYPLSNKGRSGDVHFDDDEDFTVYGARGVDLMWVATHELGHSLGLDHSRVQGAIMYPYYLGYRKDIKLGSDDRLGIQTLYGGKFQKKVIQCPTTDITAVWDSQKDGTDTYLVVTKGQKLYHVKKDDKGIMGEPMRKSTYYKMAYAIDAAYQTNLGREGDPLYDVIFADQGYYIYQGFERISGPHSYIGGNFNVNNFCKKSNPRDGRPLKINFPAHVRKIDAVMKWQRNNKVYFFTGLSYYRYDEKMKKFDCGYPRLIEPAWRGLPGSIDAAYSSPNGKTFFIKGEKIYYLDDTTVRVKEDKPKNIRTDILRCQKDN